MHILVTKYTYDHKHINSNWKKWMQSRDKFHSYCQQIRALYFQHYQFKD